MMPLGHLAPLAERQLAAWEEIARGLSFVVVPEIHARCTIGGCGQSVWVIERGNKQYRYTDAELLALKVAHLRQAHADLDPDR